MLAYICIWAPSQNLHKCLLAGFRPGGFLSFVQPLGFGGRPVTPELYAHCAPSNRLTCSFLLKSQPQPVTPGQLTSCCRDAAVRQEVDPKVVAVYQAVGKIMSRWANGSTAFACYAWVACQRRLADKVAGRQAPWSALQQHVLQWNVLAAHASTSKRQHLQVAQVGRHRTAFALYWSRART